MQVIVDAGSSLKLSELVRPLATSIKSHYGRPIRIVAEISKVTRGTSATFIELVEYETVGSGDATRQEIKTQVSAIVYGRNAKTIDEFERVTGSKLAPELMIDFEALVEFTPSRTHLIRLDILSIDPRRTLGDMHYNILKIKDSLKTLGIHEKNKSRREPFDYFKIALLGPANSAGLADFNKNMGQNLNTRCIVDFFPLTVSGPYVSEGFERAFNTIENFGSNFDAVIIIRGGGSKAELDQLNTFEIAKSICNCPVPVYAGIGHEPDSTLIADICFRNFSTPTDVAKYLSRHIDENAARVLSDWEEIKRATLLASSAELDGLTKFTSQIKVGAINRLSGISRDLKDDMASVRINSVRKLSAVREGLQTARRAIFD